MLPIIFSLILGATHFWNEKIQIKQENLRIRLVSFVAGTAVTYVFLVLLPEVFEGFVLLDRFIFVTPLLGFVAAYLVEKYIYQHASPQTLKERLVSLHSAAFFTYYLLIGVILVKLDKISNLNAFLFFLPILSYSAVGLIALEQIHSKVRDKFLVKLLLSSSVLIGVLIADFLLGIEPAFNLLFGFIVGIFLYLALIDFVPREAKGRPEYFALGVLVYTLIIIATFI